MKLVQYERPTLTGLGRLVNLQDELDRLFESPLTGWAPALDVHENKDNFTVRVELPGLKREDIDVSLQDGALIISGDGDLLDLITFRSIPILPAAQALTFIAANAG